MIINLHTDRVSSYFHNVIYDVNVIYYVVYPVNMAKNESMLTYLMAENDIRLSDSH